MWGQPEIVSTHCCADNVSWRIAKSNFLELEKPFVSYFSSVNLFSIIASAKEQSWAPPRAFHGYPG